MWYAQQDYSEIDGQNPSLVVAFANLLQQFDQDVDPVVLGKILTQDDPEVDWWSIAEYIDPVQLKETSTENTWPPSANSIICFRRIDDAAAGIVDHYCLVADPLARSIVDSLDGKIKSGERYGTPYGWATYSASVVEIEDAPVVGTEPEPSPTTKPGQTYTVLAGESIWELARRWNISSTELIEHNDLDNPNKLPAGYVLRLPYALPQEDKPSIRYEVLPKPLLMHVSREGGAKKWSFGKVEKWEDLQPVGHTYPQNANVSIVAIAHVPVGEDTAAYYMDALALGGFVHTGRVDRTIGFNWQHLAEGEAVKVSHEPPKIAEAAIALQEVEEPTIAPEPEEAAKVDPNAWKATYTPLSEDRKPVRFIVDENMTVRDYGTSRPSKLLHRYDVVDIAGTFEKDGILYGRPDRTVHWFGIPMDLLTLESELYNTDISLRDRVAAKQANKHSELTLQERGWAVFSKTAAVIARRKNKHNKNKEL